jgi:hypothetical protein
MTIKPRTITFLSSKVFANHPESGIVGVPNTRNQTASFPLALAYRKRGGVDKRVRIIVYSEDIMGDPSVDMYYVNSNKKINEPITQGHIPVSSNFGISKSLETWWANAYSAGNLEFNEGDNYSLNRYSFNILPTSELDMLSASLLTIDSSVISENFKY